MPSVNRCTEKDKQRGAWAQNGRKWVGRGCPASR